MESLRTILRANAASCLIFGLGFLLWPTAASHFLGEVPNWLVQLVGAILIVNGLHLLLASSRAQPRPLEIIYFAIGDYIWFVGTLIILASGQLVTKSDGILAAWAVALMVITFGCAQIWQLAEATQSGVPISAPGPSNDNLMPKSYSRIAAIGKSWVALKTWVKVWLFLLNGVFLAVIIFWPEPLAKYVLIAYTASGPLLIAIMFMQRGLTRILGVAHLIPWVPLLVYLVFELGSTTANIQHLGFAIILFLVVALCLIFDVYDLLRWYKGDRFRYGSTAAQRIRALRG